MSPVQIILFVLSSLLSHSLSDINSFKLPRDAIDFSDCVSEADGRCCILTDSDDADDEEQEIVKQPLLECVHKQVSTCHYSYATQFSPHREEVCSESYNKHCSITFNKIPEVEIVKKCYKPLVSVCDDNSDDDDEEVICRTYPESVCTSRYTEGGKVDTRCEKVEKELCGRRRCRVQEAEEECHEQEVTSVRAAPEEQCSLSPVTRCQYVTRLVPTLVPQHVCTTQPRHVCHVTSVQQTRVRPRTPTKWCKYPDDDDDTEERSGKSLSQRRPTLKATAGANIPRRGKSSSSSALQARPKAEKPRVQSTTSQGRSRTDNRVKQVSKSILPPTTPSPSPLPLASQAVDQSRQIVPRTRPVFDDILDDVHGADLPQTRSKTYYDETKHAPDADNAVTTDVADEKDSDSSDSADTEDNDDNEVRKKTKTSNIKNSKIDQTLSQLPPALQFSPPERIQSNKKESEHLPAKKNKSYLPTRKNKSYLPSKTNSKSYLPTKQQRKKEYLPSTKSKKNKGYLPQKSKKKSYLPSKNKSYLPESDHSKPKTKSYLPLPFDLPPPPPAPPRPTTSSTTSTTTINNVDSGPSVTTRRPSVPPFSGNYDNFQRSRRPDNIKISEIDNNDRDVGSSDKNHENNGVQTKKNKHRPVKKNRKSYLPTVDKNSKTTREKINNHEDDDDDELDEHDQGDAPSTGPVNARKKQNKLRTTHHHQHFKQSRQKLRTSSDKKKTDQDEESPFYSLPDSIFDEQPEYFRPSPRGLAALIGWSRDNSEDARKKRL